MPALNRLTEAFYAGVRADDVLAPVFADMPPDHPEHVAIWLGEVFGGPPRYTEEHGGYPHMLAKHIGAPSPRSSAHAGSQLIMRAADEAGLPEDRVPLGLRRYIERGMRLRCQLPARRRAAARGPGPALGLGEAPPYTP